MFFYKVRSYFQSRHPYFYLQRKFELNYEKVAQTFNPQMGLTDIWRDIDFYKEDRVHPTQKPLTLIKRLLLASSNEGDLVYDPFMGSGTTAKMAIKNNRNWIGSEISEEYCKIIEERIEAL